MEDPFELFESLKSGVSKFFLGDPLMGTRLVHRDSSGKIEIHLGLFRRGQENIVWIKFSPVEGWFGPSLRSVTVQVHSFQEFAEFLESAFRAAASELVGQQELSFCNRLGLMFGEGVGSSMLVAEYREREGRQTPLGQMTRIPFDLHAFTNRKGKLRILLGDAEGSVVFDGEALAVLASTIRECIARSRQTPG